MTRRLAVRAEHADRQGRPLKLHPVPSRTKWGIEVILRALRIGVPIDSQVIATLWFATLAIGVTHGADLADGAPEAAAHPPVRTAELQEIVVTATRREETLSRVPLSVTALSQETMDQKGIKDFQDIVRYTPGVSIDTTETNAISIRGISSSSGAGTTGIYIDDTPIQMRSIGFNPDDTLPKTFDLERVEVLRGPQGTLFGSGFEGGTVRYILAQPQLTGSSTYVRTELAFTEYGQPSYEAGVAHGDTSVEGSSATGRASGTARMAAGSTG